MREIHRGDRSIEVGPLSEHASFESPDSRLDRRDIFAKNSSMYNSIPCYTRDSCRLYSILKELQNGWRFEKRSCSPVFGSSSLLHSIA